MVRLSKRKLLLLSCIAAGSCSFQACAPDLTEVPTTPIGTVINPDSDQIAVGILHSLSGDLAISEAPIVDAELLAIEEINAAGGVLGKPLVPKQEDGSSDWPTFAEKAEKLIDRYQVAVIFGGLTTESRKAMLPVVRAKDRLLWYPGAHEGQECAEHIFYAEATANQQIEPAVDWMLAHKGKSFFLVSSNARTVHELVKAQLKAKSGQVAGEAFVPLVNGTNVDMKPVVGDIKKALPEGGVVFSALVGDHNQAFFKALKSAGLSANQYPVMSVRLAEEDVAQIGPEFLRGHYATWNYFQSLQTPDNQAWVEKFQKRYGSERTVGSPMEAAYVMVHLWAQAVEAAGTTETQAVRQAAYAQTFSAPSGAVAIRPSNHVSRYARIGLARDSGQFEIVSAGDGPIQPIPWSQKLEESKGFACDYSGPEKGEKYKIEAAP
ncbi:MAG: urea ABC transporter substrate-binding protein [Phormidesmis sp.]